VAETYVRFLALRGSQVPFLAADWRVRWRLDGVRCFLLCARNGSHLPAPAAARGCIQSAETGRGYARTAGEKVRRSYVSTGLSCSLVQPYEYDKVAA
jgi:hypothetical protein